MIAETIENYKLIANNIDKIIKCSGYKISHIEKELNMDRVSFYKKRKNGSFSLEEMERLVNILDTEKLEDKILTELSVEGENSDTLSEKESDLFFNTLGQE